MLFVVPGAEGNQKAFEKPGPFCDRLFNMPSSSSAPDDFEFPTPADSEEASSSSQPVYRDLHVDQQPRRRSW